MSPLPDISAPEYVTFAPDDKSLLVCDGVLLYVFFKSQQAKIMPLVGMSGVSQMRRTVIIKNRLCTDVGFSVDKDRMEEWEEFTRWLASKIPA